MKIMENMGRRRICDSKKTGRVLKESSPPRESPKHHHLKLSNPLPEQDYNFESANADDMNRTIYRQSI